MVTTDLEKTSEAAAREAAYRVWHDANLVGYAKNLNVLAAVMMAAVLPFEIMIFTEWGRYVAVQTALVLGSGLVWLLLHLGYPLGVHDPAKWLSRLAANLGFFFPVAAVNSAYLWYFFSSPPVDIRVTCYGILMVVLFATFFSYRFRRLQSSVNLGGMVAALVLAAHSRDSFGDFVVVAIVYVVAGIAAVYSRQNFMKYNLLEQQMRQSLEEQRRIIATQSEELAQAEVYRAIASTTQMLAHDVRKPFSILVMGLKAIAMSKDAEKIQDLSTRLLPEVHRALDKVNGLIEDVMEIGANSNPTGEAAVPVWTVVEAAVIDAFSVLPDADIGLTYSGDYRGGVAVEMKKIARVFANILTNAIEAMHLKGEVWINCRQLGGAKGGMIEFTIGNTGSYIEPATVGRLFDAFYTKGKKDGTGLGLAIAKRIVTQHGGSIWCVSERNRTFPNGKVEFFFTLKTAMTAGGDDVLPQLPRHSRETSQAVEAIKKLALAKASDGLRSADSDDVELAGQIIGISGKLQRPLRVLVVDDEFIYRSSLMSYLPQALLSSGGAVISGAQDSQNAERLAAAEPIDLVISDVDMGPDSLSGFDLVRRLRVAERLSGRDSFICIHSNRIVAADHRTASTVGADAFVPKPMASGQLLRLILQAGMKALDQVQKNRSKPRVLLVEDNPFIVEAWTAMLEADAQVLIYASPEALTAAIEAGTLALAEVELAIVDYFFDGSRQNGRDIAALLKGQRPSLGILLSSDTKFNRGELHGLIDAVIGKQPLVYEELQATLLTAAKLKQAG